MPLCKTVTVPRTKLWWDTLARQSQKAQAVGNPPGIGTAVRSAVKSWCGLHTQDNDATVNWEWTNLIYEEYAVCRAPESSSIDAAWWISLVVVQWEKKHTALCYMYYSFSFLLCTSIDQYQFCTDTNEVQSLVLVQGLVRYSTNIITWTATGAFRVGFSALPQPSLFRVQSLYRYTT